MLARPAACLAAPAALAVSDVPPPRLAVTPLLAIAHDQCSAYCPFSIQRFSLDPDPWPLGWTAPQYYRHLPPSLAFSAFQLPLLVFMYRRAWDVVSRKNILPLPVTPLLAIAQRQHIDPRACNDSAWPQTLGLWAVYRRSINAADAYNAYIIIIYNIIYI